MIRAPANLCVVPHCVGEKSGTIKRTIPFKEIVVLSPHCVLEESCVWKKKKNVCKKMCNRCVLRRFMCSRKIFVALSLSVAMIGALGKVCVVSHCVGEESSTTHTNSY